MPLSYILISTNTYSRDWPSCSSNWWFS